MSLACQGTQGTSEAARSCLPHCWRWGDGKTESEEHRKGQRVSYRMIGSCSVDSSRLSSNTCAALFPFPFLPRIACGAWKIDSIWVGGIENCTKRLGRTSTIFLLHFTLTLTRSLLLIYSNDAERRSGTHTMQFKIALPKHSVNPLFCA